MVLLVTPRGNDARRVDRRVRRERDSILLRRNCGLASDWSGDGSDRSRAFI